MFAFLIHFAIDHVCRCGCDVRRVRFVKIADADTVMKTAIHRLDHRKMIAIIRLPVYVCDVRVGAGVPVRP